MDNGRRLDTEEETETINADDSGKHQFGQYRGIIPKSFQQIFDSIRLKMEEVNVQNADSGNWTHNGPVVTKFLVRASFLEIYNEIVRDLLDTEMTTREKYSRGLELKEDDAAAYVKDLT